MNQKWARIVSILMIGILLLGIISAASILGIGVLTFLGCSYYSLGALLGFFLVCLFAGIFADAFADALPQVLYQRGILKNPKGDLQLALDIGLNCLTMKLVDACMNSVYIPWLTALGFSIAFSLIEHLMNKYTNSKTGQ